MKISRHFERMNNVHMGENNNLLNYYLLQFNGLKNCYKLRLKLEFHEFFDFLFETLQVEAKYYFFDKKHKSTLILKNIIIFQAI